MLVAESIQVEDPDEVVNVVWQSGIDVVVEEHHGRHLLVGGDLTEEPVSWAGVDKRALNYVLSYNDMSALPDSQDLCTSEPIASNPVPDFFSCKHKVESGFHVELLPNQVSHPVILW